MGNSKESIDDAVCEIMKRHGPDGHIDGHELITEYICQLLIAEHKACLALVRKLQDAIRAR